LSTLHIIRTSPFATSDLSECLNILNSGDEILLVDDGCYGLSHDLLKSLDPYSVYVIEQHLVARGLNAVENIQTIDMKMMVELTLKHTNSITWQ